MSARTTSADRRTWHLTAVASAGLAAALVILYALAFHVPRFGRWDAKALSGFLLVQRPRSDTVATTIVHLANPVPFTITAVGVAVIALARRRLVLVAVEAFILLGANLSTEALKPLVGPHKTVVLGAAATSVDSFPSGHATAAMALALCTVIVVPRRTRPVVAAAGALYSFAVGYALVLLGTHYPSDVIGGYLMSGTWALLALTVLRALLRPRRSAQATRDSSAIDALTPLAWTFVAMIAAIGLANAIGPPNLSAATVALAALALSLGAAFVTGIVATLTAGGTVPTGRNATMTHPEGPT
jgi:membrane-associated phospholipid phosphatase